MTIYEEAKNKSIVEYLSRIGRQHSTIRGGIAKYISPFRNEHDPSFAVYLDTNTWCDFGSRRGGDLPQLVSLLEGISYKEATEKIMNGSYSAVTPYDLPKPKKPIEILSVKELTDESLLRYFVKTRRLDYDIVKSNIKQGEFYFASSPEEHIVAGCFKNMLGWEFKSGKIKGYSDVKTFSKIDNGNANATILFEGFINYLSALTYYGVKSLKYDVIILNGVGLYKTAKAYINNKVFYYGDNDTAGENLYNTLITDGFSVKDMRYEYNIYNDFNDKLKAER